MILNTREEVVHLNQFTPKLSKLSDYECLNYSETRINPGRVKKLFDNIVLKTLRNDEKESIQKICAKYVDIFYLPGDKSSVTNVYRQSILIKPNTSPVYIKQYRLPHSQKHEIDKQIKSMLDNGIIEETKSDWSSPILLVPKNSSVGDKKFRLVIDYRKVNEVIQGDRFPLPLITDILDSLSGSMYFSHLDLYQGYYQVELEKNSRKFTAFTTNSVTYQMCRCPMGMKLSGNSFSRMMSIAMSGLNFEKCLVYLDDLIVFGRSLESHNKNLMQVLERMRKVNLKLNPNKCEFLQKEILYLGHVVTPEGIKPDLAKTKVLEKYPIPTNTDQTRRFVAFTNYYRKFIPHFADIAVSG